MVPWKIHYKPDGIITSMTPGEGIDNHEDEYMVIDDHSDLQQIKIFDKFRKNPVGVRVEFNPYTGIPKLVEETRNATRIPKTNLTEITHNNSQSDIEFIIDSNSISMHTNFELQGSIKLYVTEDDIRLIVDILDFDKDCVEYHKSLLGKRFFVKSHGKSFALKHNKYSKENINGKC